MFKSLFVVLIVLALVTESKAADCGNGSLQCAPMWGLYLDHSLERKYLTQLYDKLVRASDNDLSKFYNDALSTAVNEIKNKADDKSFKFWILVINPSATEQTAHFLVRAANNATDLSESELNSRYLNCALASDLCPPPDKNVNVFDPKSSQDKAVDAYNKLLKELDDGDVVAETKISVPPNSVKAIGIAIPDDDDKERVVLSLLGGHAATRVKFDHRDILRVGYAN
ncbi:hypothetical protein ACWAT4_36995 [Bradyrhizobium manausense]